MKTFSFLAALLMGASVWANSNIQISVQKSANDSAVAAARTVDRYAYNFGYVHVNTTAYVRYTLTNTGTTPMNFDRALIGGMGFDAYHNCTEVLQPNDKCQFEITFTPYSEMSASGRFILSFKEDLDIVVDVYGIGSRY